MISSLSTNSEGHLLSSSFDKSVKLWENTKAQDISSQTFVHPDKILKVSWIDPEDESAKPDSFVSLCHDDTLRLFDIRSKNKSSHIIFNSSTYGKPISFGSRKDSVAVSFENGSVLIYDLRKWSADAPKSKVSLKSNICDLSFSPQSDSLLCPSTSQALFVLDFTTQKPLVK